MKPFILSAIVFYSIHYSNGSLAKDKFVIIERLFPQSCTFSHHFIQKKTIHGLTLPLISTGKLFFSCKKGLIWNTETPAPEKLIYTNNGLNFKISDKGKLSQLKSQIHYELSSFLIRLLKKDIDYLNKNFLIFTLESNDNSEGAMLKPTNHFMKSAIDNIQVTKNKERVKILIEDKHQQSTLIQFSELTQFAPKDDKQLGVDCERSLSHKKSCSVLILPDSSQFE